MTAFRHVLIDLPSYVGISDHASSRRFDRKQLAGIEACRHIDKSVIKHRFRDDRIALVANIPNHFASCRIKCQNVIASGTINCVWPSTLMAVGVQNEKVFLALIGRGVCQAISPESASNATTFGFWSPSQVKTTRPSTKMGVPPFP